ncbi:MSMB protein, partial [Centropus unirufus]|nr:MSMB protein [Centropus unirufus]
CYDSKGQLHEFGSRWRSESCYDCDCSREGISCCSSFPTPVDYDKEKCVSIFYKESCMYKVVQKDDDSKECPVHGWVA